MSATSRAPLFAGLRVALNLAKVGLAGFVVVREAMAGNTSGRVAIAIAMVFLAVYAAGESRLGQWQAR